MSTPQPEPRPTKERALASKTVAALAVALLLIAFGVANDRDVPVDWLVGTSQTPLIVVIGVSAGLGALLGVVAARRRWRGGTSKRDGPAA
jgi:uncharacterized integral membrane protein